MSEKALYGDVDVPVSSAMLEGANRAMANFTSHMASNQQLVELGLQLIDILFDESVDPELSTVKVGDLLLPEITLRFANGTIVSVGLHVLRK